MRITSDIPFPDPDRSPKGYSKPNLWEVRTQILIRWRDIDFKNKINFYEEHLSLFKRPEKYHSFTARKLKHWQWKLDLVNAELQRRKNPEYLQFIQKIIHQPNEKQTTLLVFADWLQDNQIKGWQVMERRVRKNACGIILTRSSSILKLNQPRTSKK